MTRIVEHVMGLPVSLDLRDPRPLTAAVTRVFDWLHEVDRRFSPFREDSEVSRVARGELAPQDHSSELAEITAICAHYQHITGGAFTPRLPGRPFDPTGVVKGWAVQRAGDLLRAAGATRFCLNAGGDVLTAGEPESGKPWQVGIRHPDRPHEMCAIVAVRDAAVATSGNYERGPHLVSGHTGRPILDPVSLTVVAADLTTADATSTAAVTMGLAGIAWAAARPGCLVYAIDAQRRVHRSPDLPIVHNSAMPTDPPGAALAGRRA